MKSILSVSVDESLAKRLEAMAKALGLSRSALVERWLTEKLEGDEIAVKALTNPVVAPALLGAFGDPAVLRALGNAIAGDLDGQQLQLFQQALEGLTASAAAAAPSSPAKPRRSTRSPRKGSR